ncbi:hypothetical protein L1987_56523 [Smallanthus sonchifolius]|uniref:Uncharacterized protein n=1 Tax=Smallanthus sonchifolius TaxID=185202 RepID=A0ACB9EE23_9ASTR|nr:hypothetical protein L1987_56523 [Smallanthus sonchifolius]
MDKYQSFTMDVVPQEQQVDSIITSSSLSSSSSSTSSPATTLSRYENQKRRDWNTFGQYLRNHRPPLTLSRCSGAHVLEFLSTVNDRKKEKRKKRERIEAVISVVV